METILPVLKNENSDYSPILIVDERERHHIRKMLELSKINMQIKTLPIADYLITNNIAVERKRGDDLAGSLCDTRFFSQLTLLSKYYSHPILLLEDFTRMFSRQIYEASLYGALLYTTYKLGIRVIPSKNVVHSVLILRSLLEIYQKTPADRPKIIQIEKDQVNRSTQLYFIQGLLDVSEKRSEMLLNEFETPWGIITALLETKLKVLKNGKIMGVEGPLKRIKGLGPKFLLKNHTILRMTFKKAEKISQDKFKELISVKN